MTDHPETSAIDPANDQLLKVVNETIARFEELEARLAQSSGEEE